MSLSLTPIEQDIVGLWAAVDALDSMVNHALLTVRSHDGRTQIWFDTMVHQDLFATRLLDFLEPVNKRLLGVDGSCLEVLLRVPGASVFDSGGAAARLERPALELQEWLNKQVTIDVWLPSIGHEVGLEIYRHEIIRICGNFTKHGYARLTGAARQLAEILRRSQIEVDTTQALLALPEFHERFQRDVMIYHATTVVELLNNIRWGIREYLQKEYAETSSVEPGDPPGVRYRYPEGVANGFAQTCYWDLMNKIGREPYVPRFRGGEHLKAHY